MPIVTTDIVWRYSVTTATAGDTTAGTPDGSLGKHVSTTVMERGLNGLFDDVTDRMAIDYRCLFVVNTHPVLTLFDPVVYLVAETDGAGVSLAVDSTPASVTGATVPQAEQIPHGTVAPLGVSPFTSPTTAFGGLSLGPSLPAGHARAVWVRRSAWYATAKRESVALAASGGTDPWEGVAMGLGTRRRSWWRRVWGSSSLS